MSSLTKKNIDSSLKFVYSDNNSLSVIFHDNELLIGVVGEFNKNLKELEKIQSQLYDNQMQMNKSLEKKTINVLVENLTDDKTQVFGRSEYMTSVIFHGKKEDIGKIVPVKINKSNRTTLFGERDFSSNQKVA